MKIYFLPSYVARTPSTRMRVYKVAECLTNEGQPVEILPYNIPIEEKHQRLSGIQLEDILYVQKWRTPFNAAEHLGQYKGRCRIVFDLDDLTGNEQARGLLKIADILVVGNHYLQDCYTDGIRPVILAPSAVDWKEYPKFKKEDSKLQICVAKCGIKPMLKGLENIKNVLHGLRAAHNYTLVLVGFNDAADIIKAERMFPFAKCHPLLTYDQYLKQTVPMLQTCTLSILPFLSRDNGKSGHSALANLAMGIPCVASPYAECEFIIEDGVNGFLARTEREWYKRIEKLLLDAELRQQFRHEGWKTIIDRYDVPVIARQLLKDLRSL